MMNVKKGLIIFGAVILSLLMVSSATAVSQVNSQPIINKIEEQNEAEDFYNLLEGLVNYNDFEADKKHVEKLISKINVFLTNNSLGTDTYKESSFYKSAEFQAFLNKDGGLENNLMEKAGEAWNEWVANYQSSLEDAKIAVVNIIRPFFEELFSGKEYTNLIATFDDDSRLLAEDLGTVYKARSKNVGIQEDENEASVGSLGFVLEQALITICTVIFLINWAFCGNDLGQVTELIVASILWVLLIIPAITILTTDIVVGNAAAAFEALLVTTIIIVGSYAETLAQFTWSAGIIGIVVWAIASLIRLYFLPVEFFVVFMVTYFEYGEYELGYIASHLGLLISKILEEAADNARDIWESLRPPTSNNLPSISSRLACFLDRICDRFPFLKLLLLKYVAA